MNRIQKINRRKCAITLLFSAAVVICTAIGVVMNLTKLADENFDHMGIKTFCMFTVNSNILMGIAMFLTVPYAIDGLRKQYFRLPDWLVVTLFVATTALSLTFLISLFVLAPVKGFVLIFTGSRFFLHFVCPVLSIVTFCCFICSHLIRPVESPLTLIPVFLYSVVYLVMVVLIGEEHGGWNDFYGFATRLPLWIPVTFIIPITYAISSLIRFLHNRCFLRRKEEEAAYFKEVFGKADIHTIVCAMARLHSSTIKTLDIVIPRRVISIMQQNSEDDDSLDELCQAYLQEYLESSKALDVVKMWI